ncbi:phage terminase small subunit P27 family [Gemmobacter denitrificans]|uniref:Phage terminase small subunit P27 family n=1 Tax=Gemmobacter denitrificans TaxID=3123040 RepID=A0ABU8BQZ4_9RHOB
MGRKPKPTHLKILGGETRPHRVNYDEPLAKSGTAVAPEWLSNRATEIFDQISATLHGMGIASPDDQHALALLASRLEEVELLTAVIEDGGRTYASENEKGGVMYRARPEVGMRNEAMRHAQSLLEGFGLTPSARSKVSVGKPKETNPFGALDEAI